MTRRLNTNASFWVILTLLAGSFNAWAEINAELKMNNGLFEPAEIQLKAGEKLKLKVSNIGTEPEEFESIELKREKIVMPGQSVEISIGPLEPGKYRYFGEFHPPKAEGYIVVSEPETEPVK